jgi:hypothetical protein
MIKQAHKTQLSTQEKIALFGQIFRGLPSAYGTYDVHSGKYRQVKEPVTEKVIYNHLAGLVPYGFYLLEEDQTWVGVIDVDEDDLHLVASICSRSQHYSLTPIIERSKSKGYHIWYCFSDSVAAWKVRAVLGMLLDDIEHPEIEVFPKQDEVRPGSFGNFINAPLFGKAVKENRTVFLDPLKNFEPIHDPWEHLQNLSPHSESQLDELIALNDLSPSKDKEDSQKDPQPRNGYPLPPCIRSLLASGTRFNQRIATFRLAVNLKRVGLPQDLITSLLLEWRLKNQPSAGKRIITIQEIESQVNWVFQKPYTGIGCEEGVISQYCESTCHIKEKSS